MILDEYFRFFAEIRRQRQGEAQCLMHIIASSRYILILNHADCIFCQEIEHSHRFLLLVRLRLQPGDVGNLYFVKV